MLAVGIDLCEIDRIQRSMRNPRFCREILGEQEFAQLQGRGFPAQSVAASFSAKEAFAKAMGTGLCGFSLREVELLRQRNGAPYLHLTGRAAALAAGWEFSVSISHTGSTAAAVVAGERKEA
ncbi:holo-ACP synthase [Caproicibacterium amylolyticum]|uniref:Holo-[acyl-carrier-protein] synthase n=1 Tax=Caproicibacterium amylolyticum TaxID=2766537 RepID=A0A7G9WE30_9FIRM|nr:holo-ACP synthase [Caproicibacterium amylolyticum]QNO16942.1 holo-ACP synthase [Caproicibacterium amylolyticum]